ncbi:transposase [uncultured Oscillibacter sp.]|uniref:transposase n=1 Tax=uncultured Oscillibacter sp. TaxID=876091 RepID=UPI0025E1695C|nr:transposase [uncultured Oscillibacter sp.]
MNDWAQRKPLRLRGYDYGGAGYYFVTICTAVRGQDILSAIRVGGGLCPAPSDGTADSSPVIVLTPIGQVVDESIRRIPQRYAGVEIDMYCIMPDHVHLILSIAEGAEGAEGADKTCETGRDRARPLPDIIGAMKSYTDRQYRILGMPAETKLWQTSYYDHIIRNRQDLEATRQYILDNPRKWVLSKESSPRSSGNPSARF